MDRLLNQLPRVIVEALLKAQDEKAVEQAQKGEEQRIRGNNAEEVAAAHGLDVLHESRQLRCRVCARHGAVRFTAGGNAEGVFNVDQRLGVLKRAVLRHLTQAGHQGAVKKAAQIKASEKRLRAQGMSNGRVIYFILKEGHSYASYERAVHLMALCGVNVGTLNHSRNFCHDFGRALGGVILERIKRFLDTVSEVTGRKPSISLNADKMTNLRRTTQAVGAVLLVQGEVQCILLASAVVHELHGDAAGLATMVVDAALKVLPLSELIKRLSGLAFDGQYICQGVPDAIRKIGGSVPLSADWVTSRWDRAHMVELGVNDCREDKCGTEVLETVAWFGQLNGSIASLLSKCQYGKGYEQMRTLASQLLLPFLSPQKFSATRFAASALRVYDNFLENYYVYVQSYKEASAVHVRKATRQSRRRIATTARPKVSPVRSKEREAAFKLLTQLTDQRFVGRVMVARDFYHHVAKVRDWPP
eukprot:GHVU01124525.1.p1 GENE.GHVU01124525.1~~GHVU01124525.1.p1  ORF type:complete len:474 (+),score=47.61 GHVU01124525.1:520-1941(+)